MSYPTENVKPGDQWIVTPKVMNRYFLVSYQAYKYPDFGASYLITGLCDITTSDGRFMNQKFLDIHLESKNIRNAIILHIMELNETDFTSFKAV